MSAECSQVTWDWGGPTFEVKPEDHRGYVRPWHLWVHLLRKVGNASYWEVEELVLCDHHVSMMLSRGFDLRPVTFRLSKDLRIGGIGG